MAEILNTEWIGMWKNDGKRSYSSQVIDIELLKGYEGKVRIHMTPNKAYKKDSDRPKFVFTFVDAYNQNVDAPVVGNIADAEYVRLEDAVNIARGLLSDFEYGYSRDDLSVEAERFMKDRAKTVARIMEEDI